MKLKKTIAVLLVIILCLPMISEIRAEAEETVSNTTEKETTLYISGSTTTEQSTKKTTTKKTTEKLPYTKSDLRLMSCIIFCEAAGEPYAGKLGVGIVVMNRVKSKAFPNTIRGVIYQKRQFTPTRNGSMNKALKRYDSGKFTSAAEKASIQAAKEVLTGTKKVVYGTKKINMSKFLFFSRYVKGKKAQISRHQFK